MQLFSRQMRILFWWIVLFVSVGCTDTEAFSNDKKNNVVGMWSAELNAEFYSADSIYLTTNSFAELVFNADGSGTWTPELGIFDPFTFSWYYQISPERYLLLYPAQGISPPQAKTYDVILNEPHLQQWTNTIHFQDQVNPEADSIRYKLTLHRL